MFLMYFLLKISGQKNHQNNRHYYPLKHFTSNTYHSCANYKLALNQHLHFLTRYQYEMVYMWSCLRKK
jgi:hypothetical protein